MVSVGGGEGALALSGFDTDWELVHRERQWGIFYDPRLITCIWRRYATVKDRSDVRIVDIGCGVGAQTLEMARLGYSVLGIDGSPSAISRAKEFTRADADNVGFIVADITKKYIEMDGFIDCVTDASCLECLTMDDARAALALIARALKRDGALFSISKAEGWQQACHQVGRGSRVMSRTDINELYGEFFATVMATGDLHVDANGQVIPEWIIECSEPRKR